MRWFWRLLLAWLWPPAPVFTDRDTPLAEPETDLADAVEAWLRDLDRRLAPFYEDCS